VLTRCFALNGGKLRSFVLVVVRHEREAEVEDANQCQEDGKSFYNSFVLHFD
jgi:hypothetical protein